MRLNSGDPIDTVADLMAFLSLLPPDTAVRIPELHEPMPLEEGEYDDYAGLETGNLLKVQLSYYDETVRISTAP